MRETVEARASGLSVSPEFGLALTRGYYDPYISSRGGYRHGIACRDAGGKCYAMSGLIRGVARIHQRPRDRLRADTRARARETRPTGHYHDRSSARRKLKMHHDLVL